MHCLTCEKSVDISIWPELNFVLHPDRKNNRQSIKRGEQGRKRLVFCSRSCSSTELSREKETFKPLGK